VFSIHRNILALVSLLSLGAGALAQTPISAPAGTTASTPKGWMGFADNPRHGAISRVASQPLDQIHWSAPVDQQPQYSGSALLIHYGSPLATRHSTIVFPVKTGAFGGFEVQGRKSSDGTLVWSTSTDYVWPPYNWGPSVGCTLTPANAVAIPAAGGTILLRSNADAAAGTVQRLAFFGLASYLANQATYDANVVIDTPITSDALGNLYFGFLVLGATPAGLGSGIARIAANGTGSWVSAATAAGDVAMQKVVYNCAPALSRDGASLYLAVNDVAGTGFGFGYLLKLNAQTLVQQAAVRLKDAATPLNDAYLPDDGTASPTIGPDGDVYFGVLENPFFSNHVRGWMLHFDAGLGVTELPGAFGWDDTASIVPRSAVPSYGGSSPYLLLTKYNHYAGAGGDGVNKMAVLDPNTAMVDPVTGASVMDEILVIAGPTPDLDQIGTYPNAVREWCINTAAVDPLRRSALVNCEDGLLYRWDFVTNTFSQSIVLTPGLGEAYTPTMLAPDGTVFAINNATLFAVGR
jgi:hypothetical protein